MRLSESWIIAVLMGLLATGCTDEQQRVRQEISRIRVVEAAIRPFAPPTLQDATHQHLAFSFEIVCDSLRLLPGGASRRPGGMPYHPVSGEDFGVAFYDAANRRLGGYTMRDPRTVRTCDLSRGRHGGVFMRSSGQVEILVPAYEGIAYIKVSSASGRVQRFPPTVKESLYIPHTPPPIPGKVVR
jgi:hypothetical protein